MNTLRLIYRSIPFTTFVIALWCSENCFVAFNDQEPQFNNATLAVGEYVRQPVANRRSLGAELRTNRFHVSSKEGEVSIRNEETGTLSTIRHLEKGGWALAATDQDIAYFISNPTTSNASEQISAKARVRRLDLKKTAWLADLNLSIHVGKNEVAQVVGMHIDDDFAIVIVSVIEEDESAFEKLIKSYWVAGFPIGKTDAKWEKSFPAEKTRSRPGVFLWSSANPDYADAGLRIASRFEDRLILCCDGKQPVRCLNIDTGTELWSCNQVWEFQRGFVGPSVWQHHIGRFRAHEHLSFGDAKDATDQAKKNFDTNYDCSIIGGPAIVKLKDGGDNWRGGHSIFLAVSRQPRVSLGGYLGESVIYELGDDGKVISTTNLPRLVRGSNFQVDQDGVTWKCKGNQLARLEPSKDSREFGAGPGGFDCQTSVPWLRTLLDTSQTTEAWLSAGTVCKSTEYLERFALTVVSGGFVKKKGDSVYHFPISITDLENGSQKSLLLSVPFSKPIAAPETNFSSSNGKFRTMGAFKLAVTNFSRVEDRLQIILGSQATAQILEFELSYDDLLDLFGLDSQNADKEKTVLPDDLTLMDVAKDPNAKRTQILLTKGADVNQRSKNGWSPLMSAACYGCLDTVESLIKKGANVDFADNNCGGQTTLMWAARSGRSSKQKVKLLVEAGADIWKETDAGSDLLMSAAGAENIEVVEFLLERGMKPDKTNDSGGTALMSAARGGNPSIIKLLVNAGAKVNSADNEKRTALMFAADGFDKGETLKTLLELGADPNLKDSKGKNALDRCIDSNHAGAKQRAQILKEAMKGE